MSEIREKIIRNAEANMKRREMEARKPLPTPPLMPLVEEREKTRPLGDSVIKVTVYIPRLLLIVIAVNLALWIGLMPGIAILFTGNPSLYIYIPIFILAVPVIMLVMFVSWYLYWWVTALFMTLYTAGFVLLLLMGIASLPEIIRRFNELPR